MTIKISTTYVNDMRFSDGSGDGRVIMDAKKAVGGLGVAPNPKQMVLHGLAGCTGMDVVAILNKKKVAYDSFSMDVEVEQTKTHPIVFKHIKITYRFVGDPADRPHIERAIQMSKGQFCGVTDMLKKSADIDWELIITPRG